MALIEKVCSFELSKKLKEIGFKKESFFFWSWSKTYQKYEIAYDYEDEYEECGEEGKENYPAYTADELFCYVPSIIEKPSCKLIGLRSHTFIYYFQLHREEKSYSINYVRSQQQIFAEDIRDDVLSNMLAKSLIYLVENAATNNIYLMINY